jgi:hypothetical protein
MNQLFIFILQRTFNIKLFKILKIKNILFFIILISKFPKNLLNLYSKKKII